MIVASSPSQGKTSVQSKAKLSSIQALRGVAAGLVVYFHYTGVFESLGATKSWIVRSGVGDMGASGVDVFFVISGFIMVYTTQSKGGAADALVFLKRRILRIYPLYWFWTCLLLIFWSMGLILKSYHYSTGYLVRSFLLLPAYDGQYFRPALGQGWTLSYEMLFYIVFAMFLLWGKGNRLLFLSASFAALALCARALNPSSGIRHLLTDTLIVEFLYGVLAAEIVIRIGKGAKIQLPRVAAIALLSLGFGTLFLSATVHFSELLRPVYWGIPAFMIVLGGALLETAPGWLVGLGDASYSIYLTHVFPAMVFYRFMQHTHLLAAIPPTILVLVFGTLTVAMTSVTYWIVEKPMIRFLAPLNRR